MSDLEELARLIQRSAVPALSREVALSAASIILTSDWLRGVTKAAIKRGWRHGRNEAEGFIAGESDGPDIPVLGKPVH